MASHIKDPKPVSEVEARLAAQGWRLGSAQARGDCAPLSICASHEIMAQEAAVPSAATTETIQCVRKHAVNIVAGTDDIGGIPAAVVRENEGLPKPAGQAMRYMKNWKKSYHWRGKGNASAAFLLGCGIHTGRQVAVLSLHDAGSFEDPARVYAQRSGSELRRTREKVGAPETIPAFFLVPIDTLLEQWRTHPDSFSLMRFNSANSHFDPYLFDATTAAAGETTTEIVAGDLGTIDDVEEQAVTALGIDALLPDPDEMQADETQADKTQTDKTQADDAADDAMQLALRSTDSTDVEVVAITTSVQQLAPPEVTPSSSQLSEPPMAPLRPKVQPKQWRHGTPHETHVTSTSPSPFIRTS